MGKGRPSRVDLQSLLLEMQKAGIPLRSGAANLLGADLSDDALPGVSKRSRVSELTDAFSTLQRMYPP
ncbi:hypothetical protein [Rubripirellula reticaptiva]|uniref:Uncharacterized protein n=1 Tax=Rubripirellula reticaptiva TaxID=2528013 RepID=A0A5C6F7P2_9BACT|nr:hypothetical protein [Rubripirellula reticaptiva]TWU57275.1 hypothetical protein Poly59_01820 [Rubripirellula reticaptiva]